MHFSSAPCNSNVPDITSTTYSIYLPKMFSLCNSGADSFRGTLSVSVHAHFAGKFSNCPAQCPHRARISPELTEVRRRKVQSCTRCSGMALSRKTGNQPRRGHNYKVHVGNRREFGMGGEENRFIFPFPQLLIPPSTQKHRRRCQSPSSSSFLPSSPELRQRRLPVSSFNAL